MDIEKLEQLITSVGPENVPLIFTCITNNPVCGQAVSMGNLKEINRVAHKYNIPLVFDTARWAENAYFIKMNEEGYADKSIAEIATEMFSYCDAFTMSAKKDGHANMGGMLAFRDKGLFWKNFSDFNEDGTVKTDVGVLLKVKQISCYGNDSYGGMSGRDIMALAVGLYESCDFNYMNERVLSVTTWQKASTTLALRALYCRQAATLYTSTWMSSSTASAATTPSLVRASALS